jgi:transforming growth factor-beta-induced protein
MRRYVVILVALLLAVLMIAPVAAQDQSIVEIAAGNENFSTLVAAIQNADPAVLETLNTDGPFTVFAPTNQAFSNLIGTLNTTAEDLLANTELLTTVLLYHVVSGEVFASDVVALDGQSVPTLLDGAFIGVAVEDGNVVLNGIVNVVQTDIDATNGVIHVIDNVLLPQSVIDMLAAEEPVAEEAVAEEVVNIRVAHLSPDTPAVDVYVDGEAAITDLAFGSITDFVTLPAGSYELAVAPAGTSIEDAAIGPAAFDLPANTFITVAAIGSLEAGTLTPAVIAEEFAGLAEGSARVTVFHAIEDAPAVDIRAGNAAVISMLAYPGTMVDEAGDPNDGVFTIDVPAGTYDLAVVPSGATEPVVIDLSGTELAADTYYFVAAVGTLEDPSVALAGVDAATVEELRGTTDDETAEGEMTAEPTMSIVEIAASDNTFSTLVAAVQAADPVILETLSGPGPFTVFAPTNQAFSNLLSSLNLTADELLAQPDILNSVLLYHVANGRVLAEDVVAFDGDRVPTLLDNAFIGVEVVDGGVVLNGVVNVVQTDILATNGVIHVIDNVLLPQVVVDALSGE